jgi:3-oxoacyl-[acyl-carrier protein] reductase
VLDLSVERAQEIADELPRAAAVGADVSDSGSVEEAMTRVEAELGPLAIMVNNAGALAMSHVARVNPLIEQQRAEQAVGPITTPLEALARLTDDEWRLVMSVHLDGTFYGTRAAVRRMAERRAGAIVNMASVCGIEGCTGHPHYSAAKAGVLGFTRATAKEVIIQGIRVNAIAPGFIDTTRTKNQVGVARSVNVARTPIGRLGTPEEIAATVAFLVSDDAAFFVGATISPNGGLLTAV